VLYEELDVEQDHHFAGNGCGACLSADVRFRANLHSVQHVEPEGLPIQLLRKQNLLRDVAQEHSSSFSAAGKVCFGPTGHRDFVFSGCVRRTVSPRATLIAFLEPRLDGAFAAAARADLHSSHLIRKG